MGWAGTRAQVFELQVGPARPFLPPPPSLRRRGVCPDPPAVVTEFCSRGSLYDLLRSARDNATLARQLDWPRRVGIALDAAKGMLYLHGHRPPIIHRDLKSPNLLVDKYWRCKVGDLGARLPPSS